ncbi:F-BAR domain only protein 2, partial [Xenoophorus captivus]
SDLSTFSPHVLLNQRTSRGPSPVTLASQDALPIAVAFTETVNAYFKGADPAKMDDLHEADYSLGQSKHTVFYWLTAAKLLLCIVKITGDMTLSFPMGIIKVFTTNPTPAVLSFKLKNTSRLEQILPNQQLLYRCCLMGSIQLLLTWLCTGSVHRAQQTCG